VEEEVTRFYSWWVERGCKLKSKGKNLGNKRKGGVLKIGVVATPVRAKAVIIETGFRRFQWSSK